MRDIRWKLVGSALLALLAAGGISYCATSDPHSARGFAILLVFFVIQVVIMPLDADDADGMSVWGHLGQGINKTAAMVALIAFASPHPQFTGVLLWLGISFLFLSSSAKDFGHVLYVAVHEMKIHREHKAQMKARIQAEIEITDALKAEEMRKAQDSQIEDDLLEDLSDFLNGTDSNKA